MSERDYPVGHPAASDYHGEEYTPPRAPFTEDFAPGSPARGGKNASALDTPDGKHKRSVEEWKANAARTAKAEPQEQPQPHAEDHAAADAQTTTIAMDGTVSDAPSER